MVAQFSGASINPMRIVHWSAEVPRALRLGDLLQREKLPPLATRDW